MFFWKRKKKEPDFESKMGELNTTVLSKKDYKNTGKIEQYVVERLEQMIELTKELDDEKEEYRIVTSYLNDIETLEKIPKEERDKISEIAVNVVQLNKARTEFLNSSKKLSDAQFAQLEQQERELPEAIKRFKTNELHWDTLQRDMKYLEREKSEWNLRKEYLDHQQKKLKNVLYVIVGLAVIPYIPNHPPFGSDARGCVWNLTDHSGKGFLLCVDGTDFCNCGGGVRHLHENSE